MQRRRSVETMALREMGEGRASSGQLTPEQSSGLNCGFSGDGEAQGCRLLRE